MNATVGYKRVTGWLRPVLLLCLLILVALASGPTFAGHAKFAFSAPHVTVTADNQAGDDGAMEEAACSVHAVCQVATLVIAFSVPDADGSDVYAPLAMLFLPDTNAPPLPQPPNIL